MPATSRLVARNNENNSDQPTFSPTASKLLITLIVVIGFGLLLTGFLFLLRARRAHSYHGHPPSESPSSQLHAPSSASVTSQQVNEKEGLLGNYTSNLSTKRALPEIRITFPDEGGSGAEKQRGRVFMVKMSEKGGIGLEPYDDDHLPAYEKSSPDRLQSLDLERIGGLKEREK